MTRAFRLDLDPPAPEPALLKQRLADALKESGAIASPAVESAFHSVPRHLFLPGVRLEQAYANQAVPTKFGEHGAAISASSEPAVMAMMLEQLALGPGMRVLEIGAGTGFNAALIARIVGEQGSVTALDIDEDIVVAARSHLDLAGFEQVRVIHADGRCGWPGEAPYDRIVLSVGSDDIEPPWLEQLAPNGLLLLPLNLIGIQTMVTVALAPAGGTTERGCLESVSLRRSYFMMLRGGIDREDRLVAIGPGLFLAPQEDFRVDPGRFRVPLSRPRHEVRSSLRVNQLQLERDIRLWLERAGFRSFDLRRRPDGAREAEQELTEVIAIFREEQLCLLERDPGIRWDEANEIVLSSYSKRDDMREAVLGQIDEWNELGRPALETVRIRAYRSGTPVADDAELVVQKRNVALALNWDLGRENETV